MTKLHEAAFDDAIAAASGRGMTKMRAARTLFDAGVAAERERCALVCEARAKHWDENTGCVRTPHVAAPQDGCDDCAAAIREGETP